MKNEFIIHVHLIHPFESESDYYFGSVASIFEFFNTEHVGVSIHTLYKIQKDEKNEWSYHTHLATIKKRSIFRKKRKFKKIKNN